MVLFLLVSLVLALSVAEEELLLEKRFIKGLTAEQEKTAAQIKKEVIGLGALMKYNSAGVFATCKIALFSDLVDFDTADQRCRNFSIGTGSHELGNLATVNDKEKNLHVRLLLNMAYPDPDKKLGAWVSKQWSWAGLRKVRNNTGNRASKKYYVNDWAWFDGSTPTDFHKWMWRQPDQRIMRYGKQGCEQEGGCFQNQMRVNHRGKWDDTFKYKLHPYACDYEGRYILSPERSHWDDAKAKCEAAGLVMAKIHSDAELAEVMQASDYFLGPREKGNRIWDNDNWFWLGGNDFVVEGNWTWADGEPFPKDMNIPWRNPNPDNAAFRGKSTQNVLAMSKWGQWDDSFGKERRRAFACMCPEHNHVDEYAGLY